MAKLMATITETLGRPSIVLGEEGRNRKRVLVRVQEGLDPERPVKVFAPKVGLPLVSQDDVVDGRALVRISTEGRYQRGAVGSVCVLDGDPVLVAQGKGAYGDAGRIGEWTDSLILMSPGDVLRVKPCGVPAKVYVWDGENLKILAYSEAEFMGVDLRGSTETARAELTELKG
ncbi:MAG: hypothetical protein VKL39_24330 [Leptolyngbyaceae bacterium]|nr:hypothetical protein [Leptolyngbyaceae bacterium]